MRDIALIQPSLNDSTKKMLSKFCNDYPETEEEPFSVPGEDYKKIHTLCKQHSTTGLGALEKEELSSLTSMAFSKNPPRAFIGNKTHFNQVNFWLGKAISILGQ